jgi:hypothetical protein
MTTREQLVGEAWEKAPFVGECERKVSDPTGKIWHCGEPAKELHGTSRGTRGKTVRYCKAHAAAASLIYRVAKS